MKRLVMMTVIKMCGEAVLLTILVGAIIVIIGNLKKWDTSLEYSNAFFIAGCLVIIAGAASRLGAAQGSSSFQQLNVASLRNMSAGERAEFIINAGSSVRLVILGLLGGILLILISVLVARLF
jgi:hypothetical protein